VRRGQIVSGGVLSIRWLDKARSIGGMDKENNADAFMGQGGMRIQAGDGVLAVAYSNNDEIDLCPNQGTTSIRWGVVTSYDNGANWTTRSSIVHTDRFQGCTMSGRIQNSLRAFDFLRTQDGNYFVAINDTKKTVRLFTSEASGVRVSSGEDNLAWRELCPGTPTFDGVLDAGTPPVSAWTAPGVTCKKVVFHAVPKDSSLFMPTLGADGDDRVALTFFRTMDDKHVRPFLFANVGPRSASLPWQAIGLGNMMTPNPDAGAAGSAVLGQTMCALGRTTPSSESCSGAGPFYPFWPQIRRTDTLPSVTTQEVTFE
jgi:hypothetical protein